MRKEHTTMKQYLVFYKGPATPPDAPHVGWPEWFAAAGDALVDRGSALMNGMSLRAEGDQTQSQLGINGYSVLRADSLQQLHELLSSHPYLALGAEYSIEIFETPN
jgi:hypothetical protein